MPRVDRYLTRYPLDELVDGVRAGDRRLLARALRLVDDAPKVGRELAARLHDAPGHAQIIGVTGNPGAGKSTVVDRLIEQYRSEQLRVAVLAVDPSSPFSGGAILGDRIRMNRHFADDGVFIRSLATRGVLGGLSGSTFGSVRLLDAAGFDVVMIETVGVGQDEIDVVRLADTTVVVLVPGMGDDVQAIKAGLLEIADIFLINKADKEGVHELERGLRHMLSLVPHEGRQPWEPPIHRAVAVRNEGMATLRQAIQQHQRFLSGPEGQHKRRARQRELFERLFDTAAVEQTRERLRDQLARARERLTEDGTDPYQLVAELLE